MSTILLTKNCTPVTINKEKNVERNIITHKTNETNKKKNKLGAENSIMCCENKRKNFLTIQ